MRTAKTLALTLAATLLAALVSLVLMLVVTPPFGCNSLDEGPTTPGHTGTLAFVCLVYSLLASLTAFGILVFAQSGSLTQIWAGRALVVGTIAFVVAGIAVVVLADRWTCWEGNAYATRASAASTSSP